MDEDDNLSMVLAMGFTDIGEIRRSLRMAKNDINKAVAILTNTHQPLSNEIEIQEPTVIRRSSRIQSGLSMSQTPPSNKSMIEDMNIIKPVVAVVKIPVLHWFF